jgi:hypothetical protein
MVHLYLPADRKWRISPAFSITLHVKDLPLLKSIQSFLAGGVGTISPLSDTMVIYNVRKLDEIVKVIIPHFNSYPLLTKKQAAFVKKGCESSTNRCTFNRKRST